MLGDLGRTLLHETSNLAIYLAVIAPLFLLNLLVPVIGPALFLIGGFYISATFFAYDFMAFCMARRRWQFRHKWSFLKQNKALTFGFGSALATALLVPVLGLVCMPMAAVGGTLLFCDLDRAGAQEKDGNKSQ
jgi:CysZ protein